MKYLQIVEDGQPVFSWPLSEKQADVVTAMMDEWKGVRHK